MLRVVSSMLSSAASTFGIWLSSISGAGDEIRFLSLSGVEENAGACKVDLNLRRMKRTMDTWMAVDVLISVNKSNSRRKKTPYEITMPKF